MNHAFLILAHDSPELLQRIVNRLKAPNHYIFIHLDIKSKDRRVSGGGIFQIKKEYLSIGEDIPKYVQNLR